MNTSRALVAGIVVLCMAGSAPATWSHDPLENNLVCGADQSQYECSVAPDGAGGVFIAWIDHRSSSWYEAYAQHLDARGFPLWADDGVLVANSINVFDVEVAADDSGGVLLTWSDLGDSGRDIFAQRLSQFGMPMWGARGVEVCVAAEDQWTPAILSDGENGAFIIWGDSRDEPTLGDVYAQRLDSLGGALWDVDGVAVCSASGLQVMSPRPVSDGQSGFIVSWGDNRDSWGDIYAQRLNASGEVLWTTDGVALSNLSSGQYWPRIVSDDAGGAIVAWVDERNVNLDIFAQRVDAAGTPLWQLNGVPVCAMAYAQENAALTPDGAHGAIVCWTDARSVDFDVYAQRLSASGAALWESNGVVVSASEERQRYPQIRSDGTGGAVVVWSDERSLSTDIYAQRIDGSGSVLWETDGVAVSTAIGIQANFKIATDGAGGVIAAWNRWIVDDNDIYAQRIERNGYLGYPAATLTGAIDHPDDQGGQIVVSWAPAYLDEWPLSEIAYYSVWRRYGGTGRYVTSSPALDLNSARGCEDPSRNGWVHVEDIAAMQLPEYGCIAPSFGDSTASGTVWTEFMVLAHSSLYDEQWASETTSGYSIDNLAPGAPVALVAEVDVDDVVLSWSPSGYQDEDLSHYSVHRSSESGFTPGESTFLASAPDTTFTDLSPGTGTWHYVVLGEDVHGNEGDPSNEASATLGTGVDEQELPAKFALRGNYPNPFNLKTSIAFRVSEYGHVSLCVYDLAGRLVRTLVSGPRVPDEYEIVWDGCDDLGNAVGAGVYYYSLEAGDERETRKMVLLK